MPLPHATIAGLIWEGHLVRQKLVIGNWKMHGSLAANAVLLEGIQAGAGVTGVTLVSSPCIAKPSGEQM